MDYRKRFFWLFSMVLQLSLSATVPSTIHASFGQSTSQSSITSLDRQGTQWTPYIEWSVHNPTFSGNPFDLVAQVVFTHKESGEIRATEMFYDGDSLWKFRFTGTRTGTWVFLSRSIDDELDGLRGIVQINPNPDSDSRGFLVARGTQFARQVGAEGELRAEIPKVYMNLALTEEEGVPFPMSLMADSLLRRQYIQEAIANGHNAIFLHVNNQWFQADAIRYVDHTSENPDPASFRVIEQLIVEAHRAGLQTVIWAWGDEERKWTPIGVGGINGIPDQRLQRYLAARLGPLPGWSMGYGFDLWEWTTEADVEAWAAFLHAHLGWPHLLWARDRANAELDVVSNDRRPTGSQPYEFYREALQALRAGGKRPVLFARRFTYLRDQIWTMDNTRRAMWQLALAGGAAGWWGFFADSPSPYPAPEQLRTHEFFWQNRLLLGAYPDTTLSNALALATPSGSDFVFYGEDTDSLRMNLATMDGAQPAVAVDTKASYAEIPLGTFYPGIIEWQAPYRSDWAIAVGWFAEPAPIDSIAPIISGLTITGVNATSATIFWQTDEPADGQISFGLDSLALPFVAYDSTSSLGHVIQLTDLMPDTSYYFQVRSRDRAGNLATCQLLAFRTAPLWLPAPPESLLAIALSSNEVRLQWAGAKGAELGFIIERQTGTQVFAVIDTVARDSTSYIDRALQPGTVYAYRLRAYSAAGNSNYSEVAQVRTFPVFDVSLRIAGNGAVHLLPEGGRFDSSTVVMLTAIPDSGWRFAGWQGDLQGMANPADLVVDADKEVIATFALLPRVTDGLIVLYDFGESGGLVVRDRAGVDAPLDLTISDTSGIRWLPGGGLQFLGDGVVVRSTAPAQKLHNYLTKTNALSLEVWFKPDRLDQFGPARIVSYSLDNRRRNFTFGQQGDTAVVRLRTPQSGLNGNSPELDAPTAIDSTLQHFVAIFDGLTLRLYRNGQMLPDTLRLAGGLGNWDSGYLLLLGNEGSMARPWHGSLYLVAIYDRALAAQEVLQNYGAGVHATDPARGALTPVDRQQKISEAGATPEIRLYSNYPNPFNASTVIQVELLETTHLRMEVLRVTGQVVQTLADGVYEAGVHRFPFAPRGLASGLYLYVLKASGRRVVGKMLYTK